VAAVEEAEPMSKRERRSLEARLSESVAADYGRVTEAATAAERHGRAARKRAISRLRRNLDEVRARDYLRSPERRPAELALNRLAKLEEVSR
jgi:creatinine amidohydrolase/Fe(II)-dependent formamide hydrolase-like protein